MEEKAMSHRYSKSLHKGNRRYMEDIAQIENRNDPEDGSFFAIFDGHGGRSAAKFTKKNLWKTLRGRQEFDSEEPEKLKEAIRDSFIKTHEKMWNDIDYWPKRKNGLQSTSGTTATVALLRGRRLYVAQLGDSGLVLARRNKETGSVNAHYVTPEHKPDSEEEKRRIMSLGGSVATVNGVSRVVWKRPIASTRADKELNRSPKFEYIPFLAVSRALGDLWSYDREKKIYIVSPEPHIEVIDLEQDVDCFMILASDGLWGVVDAQEAINIVDDYEKEDPHNTDAAANLIQKALAKCSGKKAKADNISAITVFFDQEPRENEHLSEDELSSGFTTVPPEDNEETPPEAPAASDVPVLKRTTAIRAFDFEEVKKKMRSTEADECVGPKVLAESPDNSSISSFHSNGQISLKRKVSSCVAVNGATTKRCRRASEEKCENGQLVTEVSPKSLQLLKFDKDVSELSPVALECSQV